MSSISAMSGAMVASAAQQEAAEPKRAEGSHGRDRSAEGTAEINKSDRKEQSRALDITV